MPPLSNSEGVVRLSIRSDSQPILDTLRIISVHTRRAEVNGLLVPAADDDQRRLQARGTSAEPALRVEWGAELIEFQAELGNWGKAQQLEEGECQGHAHHRRHRRGEHQLQGRRQVQRAERGL